MLKYTISPNSVPRSAGPDEPSEVTLMITVTNTSGLDVETRRIVFTVEAGDGPASLITTADLGKIRAEAGTGTPWDIFSTGDGRFQAYPNPPAEGLLDGEAIAFILTQVIVNTALGEAVIKVTETTNETRETQIEVAKTDPGLAITEFLARPVQIIPGGTSVLVWKTTGASSCTLTDEHGDTREVERDGSLEVTPTLTTVYTLSAEGGGRTIHQQVTVTVATVRILSFSAEPDKVVKGDETTFRWLTTGAASCTLTPGDIVLEPPGTGCKALPIGVTGYHTLNAVGYGRTVQSSALVTVMPAAITSFTAAPRVVPPEAEVTLSWAARWASGFRLDPGDQPLGREVSQLIVRPRQTTTYQLTACGLEPPAREVTVAVGAVIAAFGLTAQAGKPDEMVLAWQVECGTAELEMWTGDGPAPGNPARVPPVGDLVIPLAAGQLTNLRLSAAGGGVVASTTLYVAGPVAIGATVLESLTITSPSGITSERSIIAVSWQSTGGTLDGLIRDEFTTKKLRGSAGQAELGLGYRIASKPLWNGDIYLPPDRGGRAGSASGGNAAGAPDGHVTEPLGSWAARVVAAGEIGMRWEVA